MNFKIQISRLRNLCTLFISLRLKHKLLECLSPQVLMDILYILSHDHHRLLSIISFSYLIGKHFYSQLKVRQNWLNLFTAFPKSWKYRNCALIFVNIPSRNEGGIREKQWQILKRKSVLSKIYPVLQCIFPVNLNSRSGFATGKNLFKIPISALKEELHSSPFFLRHSP